MHQIPTKTHIDQLLSPAHISSSTGAAVHNELPNYLDLLASPELDHDLEEIDEEEDSCFQLQKVNSKTGNAAQEINQHHEDTNSNSNSSRS